MRTVLVPSKTEKIEMKDENISSKTFFSKALTIMKEKIKLLRIYKDVITSMFRILPYSDSWHVSQSLDKQVYQLISQPGKQSVNLKL